MTARSSRPDRPTRRPLSSWTIAAGALVVLTLAVFVLAVIGFVLWPRYREQGAQGQVQLDVIRTGVTLVALIGGAVTLWLAARRQRSTELTLEHQRLTLEHQREVAVEQRITELYTRELVMFSV